MIRKRGGHEFVQCFVYLEIQVVDPAFDSPNILPGCALNQSVLLATNPNFSTCIFAKSRPLYIDIKFLVHAEIKKKSLIS